MPQVMPILALTLVCTWYKESTPSNDTSSSRGRCWGFFFSYHLQQLDLKIFIANSHLVYHLMKCSHLQISFESPITSNLTSYILNFPPIYNVCNFSQSKPTLSPKIMISSKKHLQISIWKAQWIYFKLYKHIWHILENANSWVFKPS